MVKNIIQMPKIRKQTKPKNIIQMTKIKKHAKLKKINQFWFKNWEPKKFTKNKKESLNFKKFFQHIKNIDINHRTDMLFFNNKTRSRFIQDFTNKISLSLIK